MKMKPMTGVYTEHWTGEVSADKWVPVILYLIGHLYYERNILF